MNGDLTKGITDNQLILEIYLIIGRADPTDADLRGAAKQVASLIEKLRPNLAARLCAVMRWPAPPLFRPLLAHKTVDRRRALITKEGRKEGRI